MAITIKQLDFFGHQVHRGNVDLIYSSFGQSKQPFYVFGCFVILEKNLIQKFSHSNWYVYG